MSLPWWFKISAKLVLARIPLPNSFWRRLKLFRHGAMENPAYALRIFNLHFARWQTPHPAGWTCLELGPGDSLFTALIAHTHGAGQVWLVDAGRFASTSLEGFRELARLLQAEELNPPDLSSCTSVEDVLKLCNATYLTNGLAGLKQIPAASLDFVFSNAVLEHVRVAEFAETIQELARTTKPEGVQSHTVDLRDHLANNLNNLRFSPDVWESNAMASSGFYTNRLRHSEILRIIQSGGLSLTEVDRTQWPHLPLPRLKMHESFRQFSDEDHRISTFDVVLRPVQA